MTEYEIVKEKERSKTIQHLNMVQENNSNGLESDGGGRCWCRWFYHQAAHSDDAFVIGAGRNSG